MAPCPVVIERIRDNLNDQDILRVRITLFGHTERGDFPLGDNVGVDIRRQAEDAIAQILTRGFPRMFAQMVYGESRGTFDNSLMAPSVAELNAVWQEMIERAAAPAVAAPPPDRARTATEVMIHQGNAADRMQEAMASLVDSEFIAAYHRHMNELMDNMVYGMGIPHGGLQRSDVKERDRKAMDLLRSKIGAEKYKALTERGYFEEQGKAGVFRFHLNTQGGVSLTERKRYGDVEREIEWTLCVQSQAPDLPKGDVILSRWMEWRQDEDKFLTTANFRSVRTRDEATEGRADRETRIVQWRRYMAPGRIDPPGHAPGWLRR